MFILGAGFSADADVPIMRNFLDKAWNLLDDQDSGLEKIHRDIFEKIRGFLQRQKIAEASITLDLDDIENLFSLAEMSLQFGAEKSDSFSRQDIALLIVQTLERSLQLHLPKGAPIITWERGEPFSRQVDAHYGELFGALASRRWISGRYAAPELGLCQDTIITMNYDCFIDDSLLRLDVRPDYGFEKVFHDGEVKTSARSILVAQTAWLSKLVSQHQ